MPPAAVAGVVVVIAAVAAWALLGGDERGPSGGRASDPGKTPVGPARVDLRRPGEPSPGVGATKAGPTDRAVTGARPTSPVAADPLAAPQPRGLRGRVVDAGGRPIAGAEVLSAGVRGEDKGERIALTGADGRFATPGRLIAPLVEVAAARFARRVVALPDSDDLGDVTLVAARRIAGRVVAAEDGRPLERAVVEGESGSWRGRTHSDGAGAFGFEDAPEGEAVNLVASAEGRVSGHGAPDGGELTIQLSRGRAVRGQVTWSDGTPASGASVWVVGGDQLASPQLASSDATGRFEVWGISPDEGLAVLAAAMSGARVESTSIDLAWLEAGADEVPVRLSPPRRVRLLAPWARVTPGRILLRPASCPPGVTLGADAVATADGQDLAPGTWQAVLDDRPVGEAFQVAPGPAPLDVPWPSDVELEPPRWLPRPLRARVVDETGRPVGGAQVVLAQAGRDGRQVVRVASDDGRVTFDERPPRAFLVTASFPARLLVEAAVFDDEGRPVNEGREGEVSLVLAAAVTLEGVVVRPPGVTGAVLVSVLKDGAIVARSWGDQGGRFLLRDLPSGKTTLEVAGDGCAALQVEVTLPTNGPIRVTLERSGEEHEHGEGDAHDEGLPPPRPGRG